MADNNWLLDVIHDRVPESQGAGALFVVPKLQDPEMQQLLDAELRMLMDDSHLLTQWRIFIHRHLIRCGMTPEQVGELFGITAHSARAAGVNASYRIASRLNHAADYPYGLVGKPTKEELALIRQYQHHKHWCDINHERVEIYIPRHLRR